jgi:hypothetical protein
MSGVCWANTFYSGGFGLRALEAQFAEKAMKFVYLP